MTQRPLVTGLRIGHAGDDAARTGCTVLLGPFRAAVQVAGMATGTRELEALSPQHVAPLADAIVLTGGAAFGLAAADGVMAWVEANGGGFPTAAGRVPIVAAAVIFDLGVGDARKRPDAAMGRAACEAASSAAPAEGRVGAGTGATVGKALGAAQADRGGFGCCTVAFDDFCITAVAVVNALGDVIATDGSIVAGARRGDGTFARSATVLREGAAAPGFGRVEAAEPTAGTNTTLAAVVTDAPLDRSALVALARMAATALARRIEPVNTPFDGDVVFAASTAPASVATEPAALLGLGTAAAHALGVAIERAVTR